MSSFIMPWQPGMYVLFSHTYLLLTARCQWFEIQVLMVAWEPQNCDSGEKQDDQVEGATLSRAIHTSLHFSIEQNWLQSPVLARVW